MSQEYNEQDIERIKDIIEELKPQFTSFGGDIEYVGIKDDKVLIKPSGYCHR